MYRCSRHGPYRGLSLYCPRCHRPALGSLGIMKDSVRTKKLARRAARQRQIERTAFARARLAGRSASASANSSANSSASAPPEAAPLQAAPRNGARKEKRRHSTSAEPSGAPEPASKRTKALPSVPYLLSGTASGAGLGGAMLAGGMQACAYASLRQVRPVIDVAIDPLPMRFPDAVLLAVDPHVFQPAAPALPATLRRVTVGVQGPYSGRGAVTVTGGSVVGGVHPGRGPLRFELDNMTLVAGYGFDLQPGAADVCTVRLTLLDPQDPQTVIVHNPALRSIPVEKVNRLTPQVRVEHLLVLQERALCMHQNKSLPQRAVDKADAAQHLHPDATYIDLSVARTAPAPVPAGLATLSLTPAHADVFLDSACEQPFDLADGIDIDDLLQPQALRLYLRGKTPGLFTLKLDLPPSADPLVYVDAAAQGQMGCIAPKLTVHSYDAQDVDHPIDPAVPDVATYWQQLAGLVFEQNKVLPDDERIGVGRLLHVQRRYKDKDQHARAKLVLDHDPLNWPPDALVAGYEIVLEAADPEPGTPASGALTLFDVETGGAALPFPYRYPTAAVGRHARPRTLWVEGGASCACWRGIRLALGFDRAAAGPPKTAKTNGDWAAFTVVKIKEALCTLAHIGAGPKFFENDKIFINVDADARLLTSVPGKRTAEVAAVLDQPLEGVAIHFSLIDHPANFRIAALPPDFRRGGIARLKPALKGIDRADPKKLLTMQASTDANGKAVIKTLQAPQFGLTRFQVGAYLLQDPHLACYVHRHPQLGARRPARSGTWIAVWRRIIYRLTAMRRWDGTNTFADRFNEADVQQKFEEVGITLCKRAGSSGVLAYKTMVDHGPGWPTSALLALPDDVLKICLVNAYPHDHSDRTIRLGAPAFLPNNKVARYTINQSIIQHQEPDWLISCELTTAKGKIVDLTQHVSIRQTGLQEYEIGVDCRSVWPAAKNPATKIEIVFSEVLSVSGYREDSTVVVCMAPRDEDQHAADSTTHTILHEAGHYIGLTAKFLPDETDTPNPDFYSELAGEEHPVLGAVGQGPHCKGLNEECVMWHARKPTLVYCDTCKLALRARPVLPLPSGVTLGRTPF